MIDKIRDFLITRKQAYQRVFNGHNEDGVPSIQGAIVLEDLAKFCRAHESAFHKDDRATLIMLGRQEVFLRIRHQLNMTDDQLWEMYAKNTPGT